MAAVTQKFGFFWEPAAPFVGRLKVFACFSGQNASMGCLSVWQDRVTSLQQEVSSHLLRASQAEARASDFRSRLIRAHASRERLSIELQQIKKELVFEGTRKH